jgi:hypothetical protein
MHALRALQQILHVRANPKTTRRHLHLKHRKVLLHINKEYSNKKALLKIFLFHAIRILESAAFLPEKPDPCS